MFGLVASDVIVDLGHARIPHCWREPARLLLCHDVRFASVQYWYGDFFPVPIVYVRPFHIAHEIEQGGDALPRFLCHAHNERMLLPITGDGIIRGARQLQMCCRARMGPDITGSACKSIRARSQTQNRKRPHTPS